MVAGQFYDLGNGSIGLKRQERAIGSGNLVDQDTTQLRYCTARPRMAFKVAGANKLMLAYGAAAIRRRPNIGSSRETASSRCTP
jgi:hypothetical protein